MNFILLGYILACLGLLYSTGRVILVFIVYSQLSEIQKRLITEINLSKESIIFLLSIVYIITYHIS